MYDKELKINSLFSSDLQFDKHKILFSKAFKRMANKTQVWSNSGGSNGHKHRTRLTHSIEVASLSFAVAEKLGMNGLLSEIIGLAHDIGHAPFGHSGQDVLDSCLRNATGGEERFEHNDQAVRVFSIIENLDLSPIILQGLCKRNQIKTVSQYGEAQVTDSCDAIAYTAGDIEDAIRLGYFNIEKIAAESVLVSEIVNHGVELGLTGGDLVRHLHTGLVTTLSNDLIKNTRSNIEKLGLTGDLGYELSCIKDEVVEMSKPLKIEMQKLVRFMMKNVYRSSAMISERNKSDKHLRDSFDKLLKDSNSLVGTSYYKRYELGLTSRERMICDYIAGCDDKFVMDI